jgi:hypothetical protein
MSDFEKLATAIFGGIIIVAIVSVIVSRRSQAPAAIKAVGGVISSVVAAAVNPVTQQNGSGNNGANVFSTPSFGAILQYI